MLDSDNYTSDEEEDQFEKTDHELVETMDAELQEMKNKMATLFRTQMPTPLRKEITSGVQLPQSKKKMTTPLRE